MDKKVIVIGAGIAGIAAAAELTKAGVAVLMLEARERVGGRIDTYRDEEGRCFDIGASWLHETLANELFKENVGKTEVYYDDSGYLWYDRDGEIVPMTKVRKVMEDMIAAAPLRFLDPDVPDVGLAEYSEEFVKTMPLLTDRQIKQAPQMLRYLELYHGIDWTQISSKYAGIESLGRDAYVKGGYDTIFKRVYENIDKKLFDLKLETPVTSIRTSKAKILIETHQQSFTADHAICTIPLGVMRKKDLFHGTLDKSLQSAIEKSIYATLGKIYFEFEEVFWRTDQDRFVILGETKVVEGEPKPFDCPVFFTNGALIYGRPSLVCLTGPPLTDYIEAHPEVIESYFKPLLEVLRVDKSKSLPKITFQKATNWTQDEYAYGSYSALGAGQTFDEIVMPFINGQGNLRFAGEHSTMEANGCVHGAYGSGRREAAHVLNSLGLTLNPSA